MQRRWCWRVAGVHRMRAFVQRALSAPTKALLRAAMWPLLAVLLAGVVLPENVLAQSEVATATATLTPTATAEPEPTATTCGSSPLQGRTQKVVDAIVAKVAGITDCASVTAAHLAAITFLNLGNHSLTALQSGDFTGLTGLQWLYLQDNQLIALPANQFAGLTGLQRLYLHGNQLHTLPANQFAGLTSLERLLLHDNQLSTLPTNLFTGLTGLQWLYLQDNQLIALPANHSRG